MPRFMLRAPYGARESELRVRDFDFSEEVIDEHENYLWGPASIALTAKIADSFAKRIAGAPISSVPLGGGAVFNLPLHQYQQGGELKTKNPCEAAIEDRKEFEFAEQGFIALIPAQGQQQRRLLLGQLGPAPQGVPAHRGGPGRPDVNYMLGTRLPYMFVDHPPRALPQGPPARADRHLEESALTSTASSTTWIRQYVSTWKIPRLRRPLAQAPPPPRGSSSRRSLAKSAGIAATSSVVPHLKYEGASFELSLVGKLDKE
jgi:type VI secretion system protein ImpC